MGKTLSRRRLRWCFPEGILWRVFTLLGGGGGFCGVERTGRRFMIGVGVTKWGGSQTKVASEEMIERGTGRLGDPTHGVVAGEWFYYIANSGWNVLDEHGDVNAGERLSPGSVMRYKVR